jgi:hypothetical protein
MARSSIKWKGQGQYRDFLPFVADNSTITFDATQPGGSSAVGKAVAMSAAGGVIKLAADGDAIIGKLDRVEGDLKCTVQVRGVVQLPSGAGASLTRGKKIVGDLDSAAPGYIREVATGTAAELGVARGIILDAADTAAVWVYLE